MKNAPAGRGLGGSGEGGEGEYEWGILIARTGRDCSYDYTPYALVESSE